MHPLLAQASCKFEEKEQNELWFDSSVPEITLWQRFPAANTHSSSERRNDGVQAKHTRGWRDSQQIRQLFFVPIHKIHLGYPGHVKGTFLGWADACWAPLQPPVTLISGALTQHFQQLPRMADGDPWEWDWWNSPEPLIFSLRLSESQCRKHAKSILTVNHNKMLSKRLDLQKASCKQRQSLAIGVTVCWGVYSHQQINFMCKSSCHLKVQYFNHVVHLESSCCHSRHSNSIEGLFSRDTGLQIAHFWRRVVFFFFVVFNFF